MNIQKISLKNFKCFENSSFELNSNFTVIVGDNGAGKSSILDALAIAAGVFLQRIDEAKSREIELSEIRLVDFGENIERQITLEISAQAFFGIPSSVITWGMKVDSIHENTVYTEHSETMNQFGYSYAEAVRSGQDVVLPIITYYGTDRLWLDRDKQIDTQSKGSRLELGYRNWQDASSNSKGFLSWMKTAEITAIQKGEKSEFLEAVKMAIANCVDEWQKIYFDFKEDDLVGSKADEQGKGNSRLPFRLMSDGVRNMIGMVADIAYRCVMLNPHLGENAIKETTGIVLIDELDLHLHPSWQKRVVSDLKTTFPKIQFVASTHSPFIIQSLESDELINLDRETDVDFQGLGIEEITETVMGVENKKSKAFVEMEDVATEYYKLIEQGKNAKNEKELNNIKERLDELLIPFTDDPAFSAQLKMERLAKLGK